MYSITESPFLSVLTIRRQREIVVWVGRIELPLQASKARRLPLSYTQIEKQDDVSKPGLEPTTRPPAGQPAESLVAEKCLLYSS